MALPVLSDLRTMVRALLADAEAACFENTLVDQAARQALGEMGRVYGAALAVKDLDSAAATTLEAEDVPALVLGSAGYALRSRCVDLSEMHTPGDAVPPALGEASQVFLAAFGAALESIRQHRLRTSAAVPYTGSPFPLDG
jgi:hypothetical protein